MTARKPIDQLERPRRVLGDALRTYLSCPLCRGEVRVVAYRRRTVRLECASCFLRYSVDIVSFALALIKHPSDVIASDPRSWALAATAAGRLDDDDKGEGAMRELISDMGLRALESDLRARGKWEAFVERTQAAARDEPDA